MKRSLRATRKRAGRARSAARVTAAPERWWLTDAAGSPQQSFEAGEAILIAGRGLAPSSLCEMTLIDPARPRAPARGGILLARLTTDCHALPPTELISHLG